MPDIVAPSVRSRMMAAVRQKDTKPEMFVRSLLHRLGYRFRLHPKTLPGRPDILLPKYKVAVFVHGCFWHQHPGCGKARRPSTNRDYWVPKLRGNIARDRAKEAALAELGWRVITIWECETRSSSLSKKLIRHLEQYESS